MYVTGNLWIDFLMDVTGNLCFKYVMIVVMCFFKHISDDWLR